MKWKFSDYSKRCYSYDWWNNYIGNKYSVNLSPNTVVKKDNIEYGLINFYLHDSKIISLSWLNNWRLSSCGYYTHTTKKRLNQLGPVHVYQSDWLWLYKDSLGITRNYEDGMIVNKYGEEQDQLCWTKLKL